MTKQPKVVFLSAVGGGPISRIVDAIAERPRVEITTTSAFSTTQWKRLRGHGGIQFLAARLLMFFAYPLGAIVRASSAEVIIASTNPFWLPNVLLSTRRLHGCRVITLVYDVYPDSLGGDETSLRWLRRLMHRLNQQWTMKSDAVVYISESMRDTLTGRYGTPDSTHVIVTGTDCSEFDEIPPQRDLEGWVNGKILISYVGNAGHAHDVETLIGVLSDLEGAFGDEVALLVAATGARAPRLANALHQLNMALWTEPVLSEERWRWVQARTDIAAVTLAEETATGSMPSKFFSALGAGAAVLAVAPRTTDLYRLTESLGVGVAVEPGDPDAGARRVRELIQDRHLLNATKVRARNVALDRFDVSTLAATWESAIASVREPPPRG